jgi:sugar phosphate isomerase/epimerase
MGEWIMPMELVMFSKMLGEFPVAEAARRIKGLGFAGVDLTVRPGGHVLPERVAKDLPEAVKVIQGAGLSVPMITTAITRASDPHAEAILASAAALGIRRAKLGYWNAPKGGLAQAIDRARHELDGLERLAESSHLTLGLHNHSGPGYVNCQPMTIWTLIRDRNPAHVAAYFDAGHAAVEGGSGGWRQGLELLGPRIRMVAVKDFAWTSEPGRPKVVWKDRQVPLANGIVPWPEFFASLNSLHYDGPVSLHSEYKGSHSWRDLSTDELIAQTAEDLAFVKRLVKS